MEKILIIQTAFIGDAVLTLPMLQKLKELNPNDVIDVIAIPSTVEIFKASPHTNDVIVLDKRGKHKSIFKFFSFCRMIKEKKYDKIYSPHRSFRSAIMVLQSKVRETYGFDISSLMHAYKYLVEYKTEKHEVQRNLDLIGYNYIGEEWKIIPEVIISDPEISNVEKYFKEIDVSRPLIVAPGSIWNTKKYPQEYFEKAIEYFLSKNEKIILAGGEQDREICEDIAAKFSENVFSSAGKFSLIESIEILKRSKLLICNDSAPAHLGMCADIPVLMLYCSTVDYFGFFPYNNKSSYLSYDDLSCKPCGIHGYEKCPIGTFACGYNLTPENVIKKAEEMLLPN